MGICTAISEKDHQFSEHFHCWKETNTVEYKLKFLSKWHHLFSKWGLLYKWYL